MFSSCHAIFRVSWSNPRQPLSSLSVSILPCARVSANYKAAPRLAGETRQLAASTCIGNVNSQLGFCDLDGILSHIKLRRTGNPRVKKHLPIGLSVRGLRSTSDASSWVPEDCLVPLYQRDAQYVALAVDVLGWRDTAVLKAEHVGNAFQARDGGPSSVELKREVDWLLDDAIEAEAGVPHIPGTAPDDIRAMDASATAGSRLGLSPILWQRTTWEAVKRRQALLRSQHRALVAVTATAAADPSARPSPSSNSRGEHQEKSQELAAGGQIKVEDLAGSSATSRTKSPLPAPALAMTSSSAPLGPSPSPVGAPTTATPIVAGSPSAVCVQLVRLRAPLSSLDALWSSRLEQRVPFQYLVGAAHWRDLVLAVRPGVLIPRPETEMLVDLVERQVDRDLSLARGPWADVGTGSGAIAIALAKLLSSKRSRPSDNEVAQRGASPLVWAVDISPDAVTVASANVRRCGVEGTVRVCRGRWLDPLIEELGPGVLSGVVSNPPYIPSPDMPHLQEEVRRHEPSLALDGGGQDGLASIRELIVSAAQALRPGGFLALETNGDAQCQALKTLLSANRSRTPPGARSDLGSVVGDKEKGACFTDVTIVSDLNDIPRFVTAKRCG